VFSIQRYYESDSKKVTAYARLQPKHNYIYPMKNVLIVHAHPEPKSFCSALKDMAQKSFEEMGWHVYVSDLYDMGFQPVGSAEDFTRREDENYFKYQKEQVNAFQHGLFSSDVKEEMDKFLQADVIVFNFPLWWFGLPAILKGWVDRVFAMGFAYGAGKGVYDNGSFKEKTAWISCTTGGPEMAYGPDGKNGELSTILYPIEHGMLHFVGMTVLPAFVSFAPVRKNDEERQAELMRYADFVKNHAALRPIYKADNQ